MTLPWSYPSTAARRDARPRRCGHFAARARHLLPDCAGGCERLLSGVVAKTPRGLTARSAGFAISRHARLSVPARRQAVVVDGNGNKGLKTKPVPQALARRSVAEFREHAL